MVEKVKNTVPWHMLLMILKERKLFLTFYENELQKKKKEKIKKEFRIKNLIRRKGNKLFDKWKDYDNSFNSRIDKRDIV